MSDERPPWARIGDFLFASELRARPGSIASVEDAVRPVQEDSSQPIAIDLARGELQSRDDWREGVVTGFCRLARTEELAAVLQNRDGLAPLPPCPFRGDRVGWLLWAAVTEEDSERIGMGLAAIFRGRTIDLRAGAFFDGFVETTFSLPGNAGKWGFDDGDGFLRRDAAYMAYAYETISQALRAAGIAGMLQHLVATCHNPFRLEPYPQEADDSATVKLWVRHPYFFHGDGGPEFFRGTIAPADFARLANLPK